MEFKKTDVLRRAALATQQCLAGMTIVHLLTTWRLLKWGLIVFQISMVLLLRAHYFMDVYAAFFSSIVIYYFIQKIRLPYWLDIP